MKTARRQLLSLTVLLGALAAPVLATPAVLGINPVTPIPLDTAIRDAVQLADRHDHATVMRITGTSMLPYFGDGSVVVVRPLAAERLREGMIVVYTNADGERIAHRIVGATATGWTVRGYNNDRADTTEVSAANLLGVVYATFHSRGLPSADTLAAALTAGIPVALAAPAK